MTGIMLGKPVAAEIEARVEASVAALKKAHGLKPRLAIVLVGKSPASQRYVRKKQEACGRLGMEAELHTLDDRVDAKELREAVAALNADRAVHGILVQLPLPPHVEEPRAIKGKAAVDKFAVFDAISAEKDVDGVSRHCIAELYRAQQNELVHLPATAIAIRRMLAFYRIETRGKVALVVGRNDITAKPVHHMLGGRMCNATAVWCHRHTPKEDHDEFMRKADIVVTSVGKESYKITGGMLKPGAAVIDIGTRVGPDGKIHGDVDFDSVRGVASHVTPVPGGVGPVTVAALMENLLRAARFARGIQPLGYEF